MNRVYFAARDLSAVGSVTLARLQQWHQLNDFLRAVVKENQLIFKYLAHNEYQVGPESFKQPKFMSFSADLLQISWLFV